MTTTIKLYHWQTKSFARHKASDDLHSKLQELIDEFVEVYIGRYGRPRSEDGFKIHILENDDDSMEDVIYKYIDYLKNGLPAYFSEKDTDLQNIRDEMLQILNKTLYLFTLN